jgi:N-acetylglutamate synthase-like GNAT family acetyltransferase
VIIRPAFDHDAGGIAAALAANHRDVSLFQRSPDDVRQNLGDFIVAEGEHAAVLGCAALHRHTGTLGEILSVAVLPDLHGIGIGGRLVEECTRRAREIGLKRLWLATTKPEYFERFGYRVEPRSAILLASPGIVATKLRQLYEQPMVRWLPTLFGRHTFMARSV